MLGYNGAAFFTDTEREQIENIFNRFEIRTGISLDVKKTTFECCDIYDPSLQGKQTGYIINGKTFRKEPCVETWKGYVNRIESYLFKLIMGEEKSERGLRYNTIEKCYEFISDNYITYSLYEGVTITNSTDIDDRKTTDIIFIVLDEYSEMEIGTYYVGFIYGAAFLGEDNCTKEAIKAYVDAFEREKSELVKLIQKGE